jgi:hypothetical protein
LWGCEIATRLSGARNDKEEEARNNKKQEPDESGNYKNLEVKVF